ncbi:PhzF family phenazine biosynthesis protein [Anaerotignum sp. MB30-C6]|uniref:PhzF family phenazine biosynthesis protein n=1 Tax=Anaerotignum sp. MB30-C6 TaxID=3070814 RepID=UPI0027DC7A4D|nr:PhzF family phenazine biosynthesis protein [Anaerotignum sp. MB30-C6]WMI81648.1 PhzF family phenazine biosynthesis protein [Anaerotignum sp. MB30-C6]
MKYFVVDAFAENIFGGNPAGVCVLEKPLSTETMQKIAAENNLSETAFVYKKEVGKYDLKWFTPMVEIDLCGHATLGTAYVVAHFVDTEVEEMEFFTLSGTLNVVRDGDLFKMDFPSRKPQEVPVTEKIIDAIGVKPVAAYLSRDLILELEDGKSVKELNPDFHKVLELEDGLGLVVTAKDKEYDFVSRCFFPKLGVNEDPVTGSAHSSLIPFWAEKLRKQTLIAKQVSKRGGVLNCMDGGERVYISGGVVLYLKGEIFIR